MKHRFIHLLICGIFGCGFAPLLGQAPDDIAMPSRQFFIENKGQWPEEVKFLTRVGGMDAWVTDKGITYDFYTFKKSGKAPFIKDRFLKESRERRGHIVDMRFKNALESVETESREEQPGVYNYLIGHDESKWARGVKLFKEVSLLKVYDGIDARIYLDEGSLRYDMVLKAGADPAQIAMTFDGAEKVSINRKGELVLKTSLGDVVQQKLFAFQTIDGKKKKVECKFALKNGDVGFEVGKYDRTKPLVIDPLIYSTYIGGIYTDEITAIAVDTAGAVYITGTSASSDYIPENPSYLRDNAYQYIQEKGDVIVTKLSKDARTLEYSTFVGGSAGDAGYGIAVDKNLNVYVCGRTYGRWTDPIRNWFPTYPRNTPPVAYDTSYNENGDAFAFKLNASGSGLIYSTFIGGSGMDEGSAIAIDRLGNAYITGITLSNNIIPASVPGFDKTLGPGTDAVDAFVVKLNATGTALVYASYLGNTTLNTQTNPPRAMNDMATGIAVDGSGNAYVTGYTSSEAFPTTIGAADRVIGTGIAFQPPSGMGPPPDPVFIHAEDIFITKFNSTGTALVYSTFIGGDSSDFATSIAVDRQGNAWVTGSTHSNVHPLTSYPITPDAFDANLQKTTDGMYDACLTKLNPAGSQVLYSTFIGGRADDEGMAIAVDSVGSVYIAGSTSSADFPKIQGLTEDTTLNGMQDAFVMKFPASGGVPLYNSLLGGNSVDRARGIAVDTLKDAYVAGSTQSANFPFRAYPSKPYDSTYSSSPATEDGFIAKFRMGCNLVVDAGRDTVLCPGDSVLIGNRVNAGTGLAPFTYVWTPNIDITANAFEAVVRPSVTRKYYLTVTDRIGCVMRDSVTVTINPAIVAEAGANIEVCAGQDTVLGKEATGGTGVFKYQWTPSAGLSSDTVARPRLTAQAATQKYFVLVTDSRGCTGVDSVTVTITNPVSFTSTSPATGLDFGSLSACEKDDSLTFTITNQSGRVVKVTDYIISNSAFKVTTPTAGFNLAADPSRADAKKTLTVKFSPLSSGVFKDSLQLITAPCGEAYTVYLSGTKLESLVKADTNIYNFGRSYTCEPAGTRDTTVTIRNSGSGDIIISAPSVPAPYALIDPPLSEFPKTLKKDEFVLLKVRLTVPAGEGPSNAILEVPYESQSCPASSLSIDLLSNRVRVAADISFKSIQLQDITGCDTYRDTTVTFTNTGSEPVTIHSMDPASGLQLLGTLPVTLQPGETIVLAVRYAPVGSMTSVQAVFTYGPCDEKLTATLTGSRKGIAFEMPESITADTVVLCQANSSQGSASITNQSGVEVTLTEDAIVTGPFTVEKLLKGSVFQNGVPHSFDYTFTPTSAGTFSGSITLKFDLCEFDTTILLKATAGEPQLTVNQATLAMGVVAMGGFKRDSVEIRNTGTTAATITGLTGLSAPFSIVSPAPGFTLQPGGSRFVTVRYDATSEGVFKDTLIAESNAPCDVVLQTEITAGEIASVAGISDIQLDILNASDTARSGETVNVVLKINSSKNLIQSKANNYTAVISFNKNLLKPTGATPVGTINGSRRSITISGTRSDTLGVLKEMSFTALLGDSACTDITLDSFTWTDGNATATTGGAEFCLAELCKAGGSTRLVSAGSGEFMLMQSRPNPAGEETVIEYNLVEPGKTTITISDMLGRTVATIVNDSQHAAGRYSVRLNTKDIPNGLYMVVLKTPTQSTTQTLQVSK